MSQKSLIALVISSGIGAAKFLIKIVKNSVNGE
jgi:hypothetical protein